VDRAPVRERGTGGGAMAGRGELAAAALRGTARRAEGTGGRGSARRARCRPHLRETSTAKRSSTAAARIPMAALRTCGSAAQVLH